MKNKLTYTGTDDNILILPKSIKLSCTVKESPARYQTPLKQIKWDDPAVIESLKQLALQSESRCQELESRIIDYQELIEAIQRKIKDPFMAAVVLTEIRKDMRV